MSKYHAKPIVIDNIRFASTKEGNRYQELKLWERSGEIRNLKLQPAFSLCAWSADHSEAPIVGTYRGDFSYELRYRVHTDKGVFENWRGVVEDVKGFKTPLYRWKKKHVEAQYGIEIREI